MFNTNLARVHAYAQTDKQESLTTGQAATNSVT
jgi:hypothetical protein